MAVERFAAEVTTVYAELLEQLVAFEARRSIGHAEGAFVTKTVKGQTYYYFQHSAPGARPRQIYIGRKSKAVDAVVRRFAAARSGVAADRASLARLCALLRAARVNLTDAGAARVIGALADAGVFRLGGVLVGTHAFVALGNALGVRWEHGLLRTQDIDVAGERVLEVAVPDLPADVPRALDALEMGFLPVPGLSPGHPSTSFKVRGRSLRVDLLTPAAGSRRGPIPIPRFRAAAEALPYLDYLLEEAQPAAVVDGGGVLVQVPHPARFALHKLLVAPRRAPAFHAKRDKDLRQAAQVIAFLRSERPGDLALARRALTRRGAGWTRAFEAGVAALSRTDPSLATAVRARGA